MTFDPTVNDLTTVARLKPFLEGITDTTNDTALGQLVSSASNYFLSLTNRRSIYSATYTAEIHDGHGTDVILPNNVPVTNVSAVSDCGTDIPVSTGPGQFGFAWDELKIYLVGSRFSRGRGNVSISYTAGFPAMSGGAPQDYRMLAIEGAVIAIAAAWWKRNSHRDQVSQSLGGVTTAVFSQKDIPPEAQVVVNQFTDRTIRW